MKLYLLGKFRDSAYQFKRLIDPAFNPKVAKNKPKLIELLESHFPIFFNMILAESKAY